MEIGELLTVDAIAHADFDFEMCDKKEILVKMLENQKPKILKRFSSKGSCWNLCGEYYAEFDLYINGALLGTSDLVCDFIEDFLNFLPYLACSDDKKLICPFEYEGIITAFITTPMEDDKIRVSVFHDRNLYKKYRPEYKFDTDFVIKKDVFIKQLYEILQKVVKDTLNDDEEFDYYWIDRINYTLGELDKYFENPEKFKKNYELERHIRVFDVAYKDLDGTWKFIIALENDRDANPIHWEREKQQGTVLDYDIFEQYSEEIFGWDKENKTFKKLSEDEIKENIKNNMAEREDNNWVYSVETKKWYAPNEIMPCGDDTRCRCVHHGLNYIVKMGECSYRNEDEQLESFIRDSYDIDGELAENNLGYMTCLLILRTGKDKFAEIEFDYRNYRIIRESLSKVKNGEYVRFTLDGNRNYKLHIWQNLYDNSESATAKDLQVTCFDMRDNQELYSFIVEKQGFINCFSQALDEIEHKLEVTKHLMDVGEKLKIKDKFTYGNGYKQEFNYIEQFKGDYACVHKDNLDGWGIINKNLEWVVKPESVTIFGDEHPKYGKEIRGWVLKHSYLHNINGELFIAAKQDGKQYVIDINGYIQIPHVSDRIFYTYLNGDLWFIAVDYNKTYFVNSKGEDVLTLDFPIGEKFWLFDDIIVVSKDDKFGIVDWKGKVKIDFIFSEINPDKDNLDFIPVRYINQWGFINKSGKVIGMKIKEPSEADVKCSQEK